MYITKNVPSYIHGRTLQRNILDPEQSSQIFLVLFVLMNVRKNGELPAEEILRFCDFLIQTSGSKKIL